MSWAIVRVLSADSLIVRAVLRGVCDVLGLVLDNEWMYNFDLNVREATPLGVGDCLACIHTAVLAGCIWSEYVLLSLHLFDLVSVWLAVRVLSLRLFHLVSVWLASSMHCGAVTLITHLV